MPILSNTLSLPPSSAPSPVLPPHSPTIPAHNPPPPPAASYPSAPWTTDPPVTPSFFGPDPSGRWSSPFLTAAQRPTYPAAAVLPPPSIHQSLTTPPTPPQATALPSPALLQDMQPPQPSSSSRDDGSGGGGASSSVTAAGYVASTKSPAAVGIVVCWGVACGCDGARVARCSSSGQAS